LATDHHHACGHDHGPKHIYVYSPASAVRDKAAFRRAITRLEALGHEVEVDVDALATHTRFAGDDATRLAAIHRAAASGADVAIISRAAYGYTRILPGIQYRKIAKAIERGMRWVGMSDFTAFQSAVLARTGAVTWAGPSVEIDWGAKEQPDDIMAACFDDLLTGHGEGTGWRLTKEKPRADGSPAVPDLFLRSAPLWGGNLAVLTSLLGTPYFPQIKGGILFVEDISEHPYRIERMLPSCCMPGCSPGRKPWCWASSPSTGWPRTTRATNCRAWWTGCARRSRRRCSPGCRLAMCRPRSCCRWDGRFHWPWRAGTP